jgi:hypothetical protein
VRGNRAAVLQKVRSDLVRSRGAIRESGRFSRPPRAEDLAALTLDDDTFGAVRDCRPEHCRIKLSRAAMEKVRGDIDWTAGDARSRTTEVLKQMLVDYMSAYVKGGTAQMATFVDKEEPLDSAAEFRKVLGSSPYLIEYAPPLHRYAAEYPAGTLAGAEDFFYWSKDNYAPRPTISVFHVVIWNDPEHDLTVVASKRIYASHYFRAGVELLAVVATPDGGLDLLDLYRARIDPPRGVLAGRIMGKVRGGIEDMVRENLKALASAQAR